ncbi:hypothetical protein MAUB1S_06899 [Mycolicibacterium aubagnense]
MHWFEFSLGFGYIVSAGIEYRIARYEHEFVSYMEKMKQIFMMLIGASYIANAGMVELILASTYK